jgi:hypothetical protein
LTLGSTDLGLVCLGSTRAALGRDVTTLGRAVLGEALTLEVRRWAQHWEQCWDAAQCLGPELMLGGTDLGLALGVALGLRSGRYPYSREGNLMLRWKH